MNVFINQDGEKLLEIYKIIEIWKGKHNETRFHNTTLSIVT